MTAGGGVEPAMKLTRIAAILGLFTLGACGLYFTHDGTERQTPTTPDAHGSNCGGGGPYPDAGVLGDGGSDPAPDAGLWPDGGDGNDGGGYWPDAGWSNDGGGYLPDAWIDPAPDAH